MSRPVGAHVAASVGRGRGAGGFTLIELMVAVGIFAIIAAVAYTALQTVMNTRERTALQMGRLTQLQMAYAIMGRDVEQAVLRGVRDSYGDAMPAMMGSNTTMLGAGDSSILLELTRMGWRNPTGMPRSDLQRVSYYLKDDTLVRRYWTELDRTPQSKPLESDLLGGVKQVDVRFMDESSQWQTQWPPLSAGGQPGQPQAPQPLPRAVEVSVESKYFGKVTWLFEVP